MSNLPRHIAIIMDGNGRWAKSRNRPRSMGHREGVKSVRSTVERCARLGVEALTLFAFSSENWKRPQTEVRTLMELFMRALRKEVDKLHENEIRVCFIGNLAGFSAELQHAMRRAEVLTQDNQRMTLNIAVNYGGRWDIADAARRLAEDAKAGRIEPNQINEKALANYLSLAQLPEPDLLIRTGGERRISNFLLWQLAYSEFYFCNTYWPDFSDAELDAAIESFSSRQRRFGQTPEQAEATDQAAQRA